MAHEAGRMRTERRYRRRRRTAAATILAALLALVAAIVAASSGGGPATPPPAAAAASRTAHRRARPAGRVVRDGPPGTRPVPILMYHVILAPPPNAPYPGLYVTPALFAAQMHALKRAGYHPVTMDQLWAYWRHGVPLPKGRPVVLSFDNGYESQYRFALPVLRSLGWVGVENLQLSGLPISQGGISHQQVRGLIRAGWEVDTQGYDHADLVILSPSELRFQVAVARRRLQRLYHVPANWFCYPSGDYDATVIAAVRAAGFRGATTVIPGWAHPHENPYALPRYRVLGGTSPSLLLGEIAGIRNYPPPGASYTF